ncbi:MAG: hypothetical protein NC228_11015, partial [[Eubacterium] siraeum]|nr:hypothetical protein [[Eubacterium] siraeum]
KTPLMLIHNQVYDLIMNYTQSTGFRSAAKNVCTLIENRYKFKVKDKIFVDYNKFKKSLDHLNSGDFSFGNDHDFWLWLTKGR